MNTQTMKTLAGAPINSLSINQTTAISTKTSQTTELTPEVLPPVSHIPARTRTTDFEHPDTLFSQFRPDAFDTTTRIQTNTTTIWLPNLDFTDNTNAYSTRRTAAADFRNKFGPSSCDLWNGIYFKCSHSNFCTFQSRDIEKAYRHGSKLATHKINATFEGNKVTSFTSCPISQADLSAQRLIDRTHLFSNRLATLAKQGTTAIFEKSGTQIRRTYNFNDKTFTLIFSPKDSWTAKYLKLLRPLEVTSQSLFGMDINVIHSVAGLPDFGSLTDSLNLKELLVSKLSSMVGLVSNISILLAQPTAFIAAAAITAIVANTAGLFSSIVAQYFSTPMAESAFTWIPHAVGILLLIILGVNKLSAVAGLSILQKMTNLGTTLAGVGAATRIIKDAWKELFPYIYEKIYGMPPDFDDALLELEEFRQLTTAVEEFEKSNQADLIKTNADVCAHVRQMDETLRRVYATADKRRLRDKFSPAIRVVEKRINDWMEQVRSSPYRDVGIRTEPVLVYMFGNSNCGKSYATPLLIAEILKDHPTVVSQPTVPITNFMYTRNPALDFWEGYNSSHLAVIYDDFLQRADSQTNQNPEVLEIIRVKNNAAFQVPKATLSEKANSYFKSPLVICTSNQPSVEAKSITCPEALKRRFDLHVKVVRDANVVVGASANTECYSFVVYKNDQPTSTTLNFEQLVTVIRMKMHAYGQKLVGYNESIERIRNLPIINAQLPETPDMDKIINEPSYTLKADQIQTSIAGDASQPPPRIADAHALTDWFLPNPPMSNSVVLHSDTPHLTADQRKMLLDALNNMPAYTGITLDIPTIVQLKIQACVDPKALPLLSYFSKADWESDDIKELIHKTYVPLLFTKENAQIFIDCAYSLLSYDERNLVFRIHNEQHAQNDALDGIPTQNVFDFARAQASETWRGYFSCLVQRAKDVGGYLWSGFLSDAFQYWYDGCFSYSYCSWKQRLIAGWITSAITGAIVKFISGIAYRYDYISAERYSALAGILPPDIQARYPSATTYAECLKAAEENLISLTVPHEMSQVMEKVSSESWTHAGKTPAMKTTTSVPRTSTAEALTDPNCEDVSMKVHRNMAMFYIGVGVTDGRHSAVGLFVRDRTCLLNKHSLEQLLTSTSPVFVTFPGTKTPVEVLPKDWLVAKHPEHDLGMIQFTKSVRSHTDLTTQFCTDEDIMFDRAVFRICSRRSEVAVVNTVHGKKITQPVYSTFKDSVINITTGFEYENAETTFGDCGSPLLVINERMPRKILGIHGAGYGTTGFAIAATRGMIDEMMANFPEAHSLVMPETMTQNFRQVELEGNFEYLGTVPPPFDPTRTDITPSEIFGVFEPTTAPAILRPVKGICPLIKGVTKMGSAKPIQDETFLSEVKEVLMSLTIPGTPKIARVLTIEEAIFGIPGILEPIKLDTSPGYPWTSMGRPVLLPGKKAWIYPESQTIHPDLRDAITNRISDLRAGLCKPPIFKASLKDERRSKKRCDYSKPEDMKTRVFCASAMDFLIVIRMYHGCYFQHIIDQRIKNWSAVGINPDSADWDSLVRHLHSRNTNIKLGDYVGFDTSQSPSFIRASLEVSDEFYKIYDPDHSNVHSFIRDGIIEGIKHPVLLVKGDLYRLDGVNPSGVFGTTQLNNNTNIGAFYYVWRDIYGPSPSDFIKNVVMCTYGDDNIFAVRPGFPEFTATQVAASLLKIGMDYTAIDKTLNFVEDGTIEGASFLKRGFTFIDGHWRAPLDIATCKEMVNYTRKSNDNISATLVNCRTAATELAYTDPTGKTTEAIERALAAVGLYERLPRLPEVLANSNKNF